MLQQKLVFTIHTNLMLLQKEHKLLTSLEKIASLWVDQAMTAKRKMVVQDLLAVLGCVAG